MSDFLTFIKERKFLVISIIFHVVIIVAILIMLPLWKKKEKKTVKIQEIELFAPPQPQLKSEPKPESVQQKETPPVPEAQEKPLEEEIVEKKTIRKPPPEPLKSNLEKNILNQFDSLEKKKIR